MKLCNNGQSLVPNDMRKSSQLYYHKFKEQHCQPREDRYNLVWHYVLLGKKLSVSQIVTTRKRITFLVTFVNKK